MDSLFEVNGKKIYSYRVSFHPNAVVIGYNSSIGFGEFTFYRDKNTGDLKLDTEFMGREFGLELLKKIFERTEVEYLDGAKNETTKENDKELEDVETCDLVEELKGRTGVSYREVPPYARGYEGVIGPVIVLEIID